jgi:hypothetical protein
MRLFSTCLLFLVVLINKTEAQTAAQIIQKTVSAYGGVQKITSVQSIKANYTKHTYLIEQSERPTGPFLVQYETGEDIKKAATHQYYVKRTRWNIQIDYAPNRETEQIFSEGMMVQRAKGRKWIPSGSGAAIRENLDFSMENILLALVNPVTLTLEGTEKIHEVPQWKINCRSKDISFIAYVNKNTFLLTCIEYAKAYKETENFFWSFWGDYATKQYFSSYALIQPGILYPSQIDIYKNNWPYETITYSNIVANSSVPDSLLNIPSQVRQAAEKSLTAQPFTLRTEGAVVTVAKGIELIQGAWNVGIAEQADGIYIIEGPISANWTKGIIEYAKQKYPGKKIKGVITTADAWPHIAGLREYAAQSIPIYHLGLNKAIIQKLLSANYKTYPDAYASKKSIPKMISVDGKMVLNDKDNPLEIYPINGQAGERMLMLYFPSTKTLYASDLIQFSPSDKQFFMPSYLLEVKTAVMAHSLAIDKVFAMHTDPLPWSDITKYLGTLGIE